MDSGFVIHFTISITPQEVLTMLLQEVINDFVAPTSGGFTFVALSANFASTASEYFYLIGGNAITSMCGIFLPSLIFIKEVFGHSSNVHISNE